MRRDRSWLLEVGVLIVLRLETIGTTKLSTIAIFIELIVMPLD